jgi:hypothetical protein
MSVDTPNFELTQLYAVNTSGEGFCNPDAHKSSLEMGLGGRRQTLRLLWATPQLEPA